jgi:electron transport complex protein RnfG
MKEILRLTVTLLLICSIVAAALAAVNGVAGPVIAQRNAEKTQQAVEKVLPGGGAPLESFPDETGLVTAVYASDKGYAVQVEPAGFNGTIVMMVGVVDGKVYEISVISQTETPSLGAVAAAENAKGQAFRSLFSGLSGVLAVRKDGGEVDALTSATITSRAVTEGVNAALACAAALG